MSDEIAARVREGLEGTTPGEWRVGNGVFGKNVVLVAGGVDTCPGATVWGEMARVTLRFAQDADGREWYAGGTAEANARHIANCCPADLRALLDERERLIHDINRHISIASKEAERAEAAEARLARVTESRDSWEMATFNAEAELARLRAPVEGEAGEMVQWLSALNHISLEDCFLQSPMFAKAADLITRQAASLRGAVELYDVHCRQTKFSSDAMDKRLETTEASLREAREVIKRIASKNLHAEITDTDPDELDWLYAYEECVKEARAWLAKQGGDSGK